MRSNLPLHVIWRLNDDFMSTTLFVWNRDLLSNMRRLMDEVVLVEFSDWEPRDLPDLDEGYEVVAIFEGNVEYHT